MRRYQYVWSTVCAVDSLTPGRGVAVLLPDDVQAALFLLPNGELFAVGNIDPYGQAAVMSRGLTGDRGGEPTVASPLLKQVFSLIDGRCLDDASRRLPVFEVRVINGNVEIGMLRSRHRNAVAA
ncbi:nitrite reductase small subunit [Mycobacteroides saopaulense]|uniref:Nitrite reductase small subunit n=1 Tax=Mycobacteroides saopaulense TaxID=1578165 RepID=A0ABX3C5U3_9MYCO|nr:nitrite reductase small subunit [Mycobacteroides saopaulense]OHU13793.1 nitrite reductase small subunit [Mycobacteroides saopaulense]